MTNSKLIIYLKTLNNAEAKEFGLYLGISKGAKDALLLFQYLKKHHPTYTAKATDKEVVAKKLFPKDKNKDKKLVNAMQRCSRLLDEFLIQEELKVQVENKEMLLLQALKKRRLDTYFFKKAEKLKKEWTDTPPPGLLTMHYLFRLKEMVFVHPKSKFLDKKPESTNTMISHLDNYFFAVKLYWETIARNNGNFLSNEENKNRLPINEIQNIVKSNIDLFPTQVKFLHKLFELFHNEELHKIGQLKDLFFNNISLFGKIEQTNITICFQTCLYENYRIDNVIKPIFDFICKMVDFNLVVVDGFVQTDKFWTITAHGFAAKEFDWTKNFIDHYGNFLPENEKEDVLSITNAMLSFYQKNFTDALQNIAAVKFQNPMYSVRARIVQLQCYYELGEAYEDLFWDYNKSFYMFLFRSNDISNDFKNELNQFLLLAKKLYKKRRLNDFNLIEIEEILSKNNVTSKTWLYEKLNELKIRPLHNVKT